jgi:hypothetical protein
MSHDDIKGFIDLFWLLVGVICLSNAFGPLIGIGVAALVVYHRTWP